MGSPGPLKSASDVTRWLQEGPRCLLVLESTPFGKRVSSKCGTPGFPLIPTEVELLPWAMPSSSGILARYRGVKRSFRLRDVLSGCVTTYKIPRADGIAISADGAVSVRVNDARAVLTLKRALTEGVISDESEG